MKLPKHIKYKLEYRTRGDNPIRNLEKSLVHHIYPHHTQQFTKEETMQGETMVNRDQHWRDRDKTLTRSRAILRWSNGRKAL